MNIEHRRIELPRITATIWRDVLSFLPFFFFPLFFSIRRNEFASARKNERAGFWLIRTAGGGRRAYKRDVFRELSRGAVFITPGHRAPTDGGAMVIDFLIINAALGSPGSRTERVNSAAEVTFSR